MDLDIRKTKAEMLRGREVRRLTSTDMECRSVDGRIHLHGLASSTESPYDMGWYTETMKRGAFSKTLSESPDVQLLVNHEGLPLARTTNGSLTLTEDDRGLVFNAHGDESDPDIAALARKINAGLMDQCSFAFRVIRQTWDEDYEDRQINEVSLDRGDVSVVNYGANPNTSVNIRSLFADMGEISDEELAELRDDPAIITIVRRLDIPAAPTITVEQSETVAETGPPRSLETYRARAYALSLRNK